MRLLFSFVGSGNGHFEPLAPIARAAADAGHEVRFASPGRMAPVVVGRGFRTFVVAPHGLAPRRLPLADPDPERERRELRARSTGNAARERVAGMLRVIAAWRPNVVVHDEADFGTPIAAEAAGVPHAMVHVLAAGTFLRPEDVAGSLDEVRAEHGLPPDPERRAVERHLVISPFPPSIRAAPLPPRAHAIRLGDAPLAAGDLVYFSLGTSFNQEAGDLYTRVLEGLRGRRVLVTIGKEMNPAELGRQPSAVRVERFVDQASVLPGCEVVVSHGGSGGVLGALAHGLPLVLLPMGADQPDNAARCEALGVARVLHPVRATPDEIAGAVDEVVSTPSYREAAVRVRGEIAALPGPERAVELLEAL